VVTLHALVSLPLALRSIRTLRRNFEDSVRLTPADLDMIKAHSLTSYGLIAAYAISGLVNGADVFQLLFILLLLVAVYAPALVSMRKPRNPERA
jgi:hypothetical protein